MDKIPIFFQNKVLDDSMCQKYIQFKQDRNISCKKTNQEISTLLEPHIQNYFKLLLENNIIYHDQIVKKKFYVTNLYLKKMKAEAETETETNKTENNFKNYVAKNIFNFIVFLNDLEPTNGGEFVFNGSNTIECEKGRLVIFPNEWFFSFDNKIPSSGEKYCLEGQVFIE